MRSGRYVSRKSGAIRPANEIDQSGSTSIGGQPGVVADLAQQEERVEEVG